MHMMGFVDTEVYPVLFWPSELDAQHFCIGTPGHKHVLKIRIQKEILMFRKRYLYMTSQVTKVIQISEKWYYKLLQKI